MGLFFRGPRPPARPPQPVRPPAPQRPTRVLPPPAYGQRAKMPPPRRPCGGCGR